MSLKNNGYIEHPTVSIYLETDKSRTLFQFGGHEDAGWAESANLYEIRTKNKHTWDLMSNTGKLGDHYLHRTFNGEHKTVVVDPQLEYIYVPPQEFINVATALMMQFDAHDYTCENEFDHCFFKMACDKVPDKKLDLHLWFFDDQGNKAELDIPQKNLLIRSDDFVGKPDTCHFGIMKSPNARLRTIYLG